MPTFNVHDSAGVFDTLIDQSQFSISSSATKVGIVGVANKGPIGVPILVQSQTDFINQFDKPSTQGFGGLATTFILGKTNQVLFTRIASNAAEASSLTLVEPSTAASIIGSQFARYSFGYGQTNNDFLIALNGKQTTAIGFVDGVYKTNAIVTTLNSLLTGDANISQDANGYIVITSTLLGSRSTINIPPSAAATTLGFVPDLYSGLDATSASLISNLGGVWLANTFSSADLLAVQFDNDVNKTVNFTGSFIDGIDNVVDLVDAFNTFALNNVDASLVNTAVVDAEKMRITSPTAGAGSVVRILGTTTARVQTVLNFVTKVNSGTASTAATVTNALKNGYDLTGSTTLDFMLDNNFTLTKNIAFNDMGQQAYADVYYASGSAVTNGLTTKVAGWTFTFAPTSSTTSVILSTADVAYGASNVDSFDNLATMINTELGTLVTATNTYNTLTLSGILRVQANNPGYSENTIAFDTTNVTGFYNYRNPIDMSLAYGNGSLISDLTRATIDVVAKEINRQAGGIYAFASNGKIALTSNTVGANSHVLITGGNSALGITSGDIATGIDAHNIITLTANSTGTWGNRLTASVTANDVISIYDNGYLVEQWGGTTVSADTQNFIENVININSVYVTATYLGAVGEAITAGLTGSFTGGDSGAFVTENNVINAIKLYRNAESIDINLFCVPGWSSTNVLLELESLANLREDMLIVIDSPVGYTPTEVINWHNGTVGSGNTLRIDNKYMALYYPWIRVNDQFNGTVVLAPPSTLLIALMAANDSTSNQWTAPAGTTTGTLVDALSVEPPSPSLEARDQLYSITKGNAINPIIEILGKGVVVWGQKTTQRALTALNRVNVVRMIGYVRKQVKSIAMDMVFQPNDATTWATFVARVSKLLTTIETGRGLSGFKVQMDATNNPPETIAQGKLFGSIWIKPTIVAEQIELTYTVVGQDFKFN